MTGAYVDPEKLRDFAKVLKEFSNNVDNTLSVLTREIAKLNNSWRDQEYVTFSQNIRKTHTQLKAFSEEAARVVPGLEQDAQAMTEYQKVQTPE